MHTTDDSHALPAPPAPPLHWGMASLRATAGPAAPWLWHGILAPGALTLLTSQWKTGKTTLTAVLLARLKAGGTFAGLPLAAARAVVVSEEPASQWVLRGHKLDLEEHVGWFCRPFRGRPSPEQWQALLDRVADAAAQRDARLAVIDPLAAFFSGKSENDAGAMLAALAPLQALAARGLAVLVLHHPGKKDQRAGPSGRGSGALLGCADILVEMRWYRRAAEADRRRRLITLSRFDETPRQLVVELNAEGTDYLARGGFAEEEFASNWRVLHALLQQAQAKLTRADLLRQWPGDERPAPASLHRWLRRARAEGLVRQDGLGRRKEPFRYWLPESEERWRQDVQNMLKMPELWMASGAMPGSPPPVGGPGERPGKPSGPTSKTGRPRPGADHHESAGETWAS